MGNKNRITVSFKTLGKVATLLGQIEHADDVDDEAELFHEVLGLVYVETQGSEEGRWLLSAWAQQGGKGCPKGDDLKSVWDMYEHDSERYFGMGRLMALAEQSAKTA